jgi:anti-sigma regulatory factor (Ser/Thr protein kinase)
VDEVGFGVRRQVDAEQFETRLSHGADAPRIARDLVSGLAGATLRPDQLDTARLLVSELVTNAVRHGDGEITLSAWMRPDALRVEVRDQGRGFAHHGRRPEARIAGGWGLQMLSIESSRWGVNGECAQVWFELDLDGALATSN